MRDLAASLLATLTLNCWLTCSIETAVCFIASRPPSFSPGLKTLSSEILRAPPIGLPANLEHHRVNYNQNNLGTENKMNLKLTCAKSIHRKKQILAIQHILYVKGSLFENIYYKTTIYKSYCLLAVIEELKKE